MFVRRAFVALVAATLFTVQCPAQEVTSSEMEELRAVIRDRVASYDRVLKLHVDAGEVNGVRELFARVTLRPFAVDEGLCVAESYVIRREESGFEVLNEGKPTFGYWPNDGACDRIDAESINEFGFISGTIGVAQPIATTAVARIIRGADEILSLAEPATWCDEPVMPRMFQPNVVLRLRSIELSRQNVPDEGIRYTARYVRQSENDNDGIWVRFALHEDRFEVTRVCFWIS